MTEPLLTRIEAAARQGDRPTAKQALRLAEALREALAQLEYRHECGGARCSTCRLVARLERGKAS